ncbi:MAG TPA: hypothetical protein PK074_14355 [Spirochaetales bacterium]|mgnify:CR=1 FL=1|nr:hypothetical protein [Spirochaetales bacterium]
MSKANYRYDKTVSKGLVETASVTFAVALTSQMHALADYQEASIIIISVLIRVSINFIKHRFGFDITKLLSQK